MQKYNKGEIVRGVVSGVEPYGVFVKIDDYYSGLIHISELSNGFVRDIANYVNINDYVMLKVIDIDKEHKQLRLSFKALSQNTRKHIKKVKFEGMPKSIKGFGSLRDQMPKWIKEKEEC